ncbi:thioesterase domain-containing protein [uncultured Arsenicicoccus sp.]|uniref:thioesterase domain-containing protein n=1 Tax=uncultured Arsenicicoccus sp. TaxID=491339 RepID=UPI002596369A|nr:thioesterase domain-containing protein [uncultured Arsenicicoccus sp.]
MTGDGPRITGVDGGAGGIRVVVDDVQMLGVLCRAVGADLDELGVAGALAGAGLAVDATAVLSPATALAAAAALQRSLIGPFSPLVVAGGARVVGNALVTAASGYDLAEVANTALWDARDAAGVVLAVEGVVRDPVGTTRSVGEAYLTESLRAGEPLSPREAADRWASEHAGELEHRINGAAALAAPVVAADRLAQGEEVLGEHAQLSPVAVVAHAAAPLWVDGEPVLAAAGPVSVGPAPGRTADVVRGLAETNAREDGTIAVRRITSRQDGTDRQAVLVDVPGTDAWSLPGEETDQVRDLGGNVGLMGGEATAYARGVEAAVVAAGVPKDVPIALAGHSQGGMAAVVAADRLRSQGYRVTHVLAVASPIANVRQPRGVTTLALDGDRDLVTKLDGRANGDRARRVTVRFDSGLAGTGPNHDLRTYARAADEVDELAATDPSLARVVSEMRAVGVLTEDGAAASMETTHVRITADRRW